MAVGAPRKISAASARAHTRRPKQSSGFKLPPGIFKKTLLVFFVGILAWAYQSIQPPPPKICGSEGGPPVTGPRIELKDGRHLAYKEQGVPKDKANYKIVYVHGFDSSRHHSIANTLSPEIIEELGIYVVSFDRPGYGESDPNPKRTPRSMALDIEELADQLKLGPKFHVIGFSMGGEATWTCLKYIPDRLAGVILLAPVVNHWWPNLSSNLSTEAYNQQLPRDQWALRVAHYAPWLSYWWNTQTWFPASSAFAHIPDNLSKQDKEIMAKLTVNKEHAAQVRQQGVFESAIRDLNVGFGTWEFDPIDVENLFPKDSVHLWQGDDDQLVPIKLQRYIAQQLPWIHYHEIPGAGHLFLRADGFADKLIKESFTGKK